MSETMERTMLAVIPATAVSTIVAADTNDILGKLAAKVAAHKSDVSTPAGRKAIASLAAEVATSKMDLIRLGKGLTEGWRKSTAAVNAECKVIEEKMDVLKAEVRGPLTEYENVEKERVAGHERALAAMLAIVHEPATSAEQARAKVARLDQMAARDWQHDFQNRASVTYADCLNDLERQIASAEQREAEAAELARFREEQAARQRAEAARIEAERQAAITAAAVEAERKRLLHEAELRERQEAARAQQEREQAKAEAEQLRREGEAALERERQAEERARQAEEAGRRAAENARIRQEQALADAEARRVRDAADAERRRADAERAAVEAEQRRVAAAAEAERKEQERRAADKAHRGRINREVLADLMKVEGVTEAMGKAIVAALATGQVRHVGVGY